MLLSKRSHCHLLIYLAIAILLIVFNMSVIAVKFDLPAMAEGTLSTNHRCLSAYIGKNVLVRGLFEVGTGEHQFVEIQVYDHSVHENQYYHRTKVDGVGKFAFTTLDHAEVFMCFTNVLEKGFNPSPTMQRTISLTLDTGADAREDSDFEEKNEHLKPVEIELRRLESVMDDIVDEMDYLKSRSTRMRSTNESTNRRVLWFSLLSISTLVLLGCWQVYYIRQFFQVKKLI